MKKSIIIAEAGVNHNGSLDLAKKLIDAGAEASVDYVKFQTFRAEKLATRSAAKADYQKKNTGNEDNQLSMLKKLELNEDDHKALIEYCNSKSVKFLSTAFDLDSIDLLKNLGLKIGKIPSGELTNLPFLLKMASSFEELILSTGMADMEEISASIDAIVTTGFPKNKLTVLHCTTEYPAPYNEINLLAMQTLAAEFGVSIGYSDHTKGIEVPVAAVALGASVIEKHFTLDRNMEGPDHKASLDPHELKQMVQSIRNVEAALGNAKKTPGVSESRNKVIARKSIVASKNLEVGHVLTEEDLTTKRPGTGLSPMLFYTIIGKKLRKAVQEDEILTQEHLSE
jgi:N,N'-diacetyllegionaminate synthase